MNSQELRNLQEAYLEVVENQQLDEEKRPYPYGKIHNQIIRHERSEFKKGDDKLTKSTKLHGRHERLRNLSYSQLGEPQNRLQDSEKTKKQKKLNPFGNRLTRSDRQGIRDSYDLYDIILSHLLDEGYAETPEAAEAIMVNMSEEWRECIVEEVFDEEKKEFPSAKVKKQSAKHMRDFLTRPNSAAAKGSIKKSRKMDAIRSTIEVGSDPRNTMHGQDLRKI